jgi:molybdopterin molybdotransferase
MLITTDRPQGSSRRASLDQATAWIDAWATPLGHEAVPLAHAAGRVAAADLCTALHLPPFDRAAADGFALRADETVGASAYNPLPFRLAPASAGVSAGCAVEVQSGDPLPAGADAIVRLEQAIRDATGAIAVIAPVFPGSEIERAGCHGVRGSVLVAAGRQLRPGDVGLIASAGLDRIPVIARPHVCCLLMADRVADAGSAAPSGTVYDANSPLLTALVERDGGIVTGLRRIGRDRAALRAALASADADIVLVAGGTGPGAGDVAAAALAEAGELTVHGVALRPGESAGAGRISGVPVFLLPGAPAACLWAYELIAARAVRCRAGRSAELPFPTQTLRLARKIVSEIGMVEVSPVLCTGLGEVEPLAPFAEAGLAAAAQADGFLLVPEASEGYPRGAPVPVYLYPERRRAHA